MMNSLTLNNGVTMPLKGFGVFQITDGPLCRQSVLMALQAGYRMIDTAACYGNEMAVGDALQASGIDRKDLFLVSKVWIQDTGYGKTMVSFEKTLANLQTDYLDLYLIHMPYSDYHSSWKAMEDLLASGRVRAIGVCNFLADRLEDLILSHHIVPAVNQIEMHPFCQQKALRQFMESFQIQPMAWAPLAEGREHLFRHPVLTQIGQAYGKTAAQVALRWLWQNQVVSIPKSVHQERIEENFAIDDFTLSSADMMRIAKLDQGHPLILDVQSSAEVERLHQIRFDQ